MTATFSWRHGDLVTAARLARARYGTLIAFVLGGSVRTLQGVLGDETIGHASYQGLWFGGFWVLVYWMAPHLGAFLSLRTPGNRLPWSVTWNDDGLRFEGHGSTSLWGPQFVTKWYRSDAMIVLRRGPVAIVPVPARDLDPEKWAGLNATLPRVFGPPARDRQTLRAESPRLPDDR